MALFRSASLAGPLAVLVLWLACALPSLGRTRLQDVDELTHARVAQGAALKGQWAPLMLGDRVFYEKPPLLLWLSAATVALSGRPYDAWPYRVWTCLGAGLTLCCLVLIGTGLGLPALGWIAALGLALQGDFVFHARFFTFDTPFLACAAAALALALRAARSLKSMDWWLAGAALFLAAAFKSWFVLALLPAYACALLAAIPPASRRSAAWALAVPPLVALVLWVALYVRWGGWAFLQEEWSGNLMGRALGRVNVTDPEGHAAFYLKWTALSAPAFLPWVLAVPLGLAPGRPGGAPVVADEALQRGWMFARVWIWAFCLSWLLGLALVRAETINYALPLEFGLCLALGLEGVEGRSPSRRLLQAALLALSVAATLRLWDPAWTLALGGLLGLVWMALRRQSPAPAAGAWSLLPLGLGLGLACLLVPDAQGLLQRPLDPNRQVAETLLAHPATVPGQALLVLGKPTQAVEFYAAGYQVLRLNSLPSRRPPQASLVETRDGWIFYPALGGAPKSPAPGRPS